METISHEVWINADKRTVFEAMTSKDGLNAWWGAALNCEPQIDYMLEFDHGLGDPMRMRITDLIPNEWLGPRLGFDPSSGERLTVLGFATRAGRVDRGGTGSATPLGAQRWRRSSATANRAGTDSGQQ